MASKKYVLLGVLCCLFASVSFAQVSANSYDLRDSSLIPAKRIPQHNEFLNNAYPFPAKPRNQWEIGVKGGLTTISGAVRAQLPTWGFGIHARKALGYTFSLRLEYDYMTMKGQNWQPSYYGYAANNQIKQYYNPGIGGNPVFYNYKSTLQSLSIQGIATLNNINFHRAKSNIAIYALGGLGVTTYSTFYDLLNGNTPYNYSQIV